MEYFLVNLHGSGPSFLLQYNWGFFQLLNKQKILHKNLKVMYYGHLQNN